MKMSPLLLSRRQLALGLVAAAVIAPAASAYGLRFPLRIAYARIGKDGFVPIQSDDQRAWSALQTRLGALIDQIAPIQPTGLLGAHAPEADGGASCALAARKLAAEEGFSHVVLYATSDGKRTYHHGGDWLTRGFATLRANVGPHDRAAGEAYLLDTGDGPPLACATADARQKEFLDPFDDGRKPERETLAALTRTLEIQLQRLARADLARDASIAD
jgi:hypothetical protein